MRGPIQGVLDARVAELVSEGIAWQGVPYEPIKGAIWYEPTLIGGPERILSIGGSPYMEQRGVYQIKINAPSDAMLAGAGQLNALADELTSYFRAGTSLSRGVVAMHLVGCTVAPALVSPRWFSLPISIAYVATYPA